MGCRLTTPVTVDIIVNPPSRWFSRAQKPVRHSCVHPGARTSARRSPAAPLLSRRLCVACYHIHLADDLSVEHFKRRFDHYPAPVRVLARLPERHPILADVGIPLDAMGRIVAEGRLKVPVYLPLSTELERRCVRGVGVN